MTVLSVHATALNLARSLLQQAYRIEVHGAEKVPRDGRVILASNHSGWLDGPLLPLATDRPIHVLAKHELFSGGLAPFVKLAHAIPIDWMHADRTALTRARELLDREECVGIFPEGTRCRGDFSWLRDGVSYLVAHTAAPVVPVAVFGTRPTGKHRDHIAKLGARITIVVGEPILGEVLLPAANDPSRRASSRQIGVVLKQRLAAHVATAAQQFNCSLPADDVSRPEDHRR